MKADVTTLDAGKSGSVQLSDDVFGLEPRADILHRMVTYQWQSSAKAHIRFNRAVKCQSISSGLAAKRAVDRLVMAMVP